MANFNVNLSAPSGAGAGVLPVVKDYTQETVSPWVGLAANLTGIFMQNQQEEAKKQKELLEQQVVSDFVREQTSVSDAFAQGNMNASAAGTRSRAIFSKYAAQYPALIKAFKDSNVALTENTAIGVAKDEVKSQQDFINQTTSKMAADGFPVYVGMPQQQWNANYEAWQSGVRAKEEFSRMVAVEDRGIKLTRFEQDQVQMQQKNTATKLLLDVGDKNLNAAITNANGLIDAVSAGGKSKEVAMQEFSQYMQQINRVLLKEGAADKELFGLYRSQFDEIQKVFNTALTSNDPVEITKRKLSLIQDQVMLQAMGTPDGRALYATLKLAGNVPVNFMNVNEAGGKLFTMLQTTPYNELPQVVGVKGEAQAVEGLKSQHKAINDTTDPQAVQQNVSAVKNYTKQVSEAASKGLEPKMLATAASYYASTEFGTLIEKKLITKDDMQAAKLVMENYYGTQVSSAVEKELTQTYKDSNGVNARAADRIVFEFVGGGVVVKPASDKYMPPMEKHDRDILIAKMQSVTKALTQSIRMGAHMEGHMDYGKYWEENKHNLLPMYFQAPEGARMRAQIIKKGDIVGNYEFLGDTQEDVKNPSMWKKAGGNG